MSRIAAAILLLIAFHSQGQITLDFRRMQIPQLTYVDSTSVDSLIALEDRSRAKINTGFICETDKSVYKSGEPVTLTFSNNSEDPVFLFASWAESKETLDLAELAEVSMDDLKKGFVEAMISENPAMTGDILVSHNNYYNLMINGVNDKLSQKFGFTGFDKPVRPGEKVVFTVYPPEHPGIYRFSFLRSSHEENSIGFWGMNRFINSNSFTITD